MALTRAHIYTWVFDAASGKPVTGQHVHVYRFGTTTNISDTLYAASTGGTTKTNPLTTDASGYAEAWVAVPGTDVPAYVTLATDDNSGAAVPPGNSGSETFAVAYAPNDVAAGPNTSKNVIAYGAAGDGVEDDTTAFSDAVTAALAVSGEVYAPAGSYLISDQVFSLTDGQQLRIRGDGMGLTNIVVGATSTNNAMFGALGRNAGNNQRAYLTLQDFTVTQSTRNFAMPVMDLWQTRLIAKQVEFVNIVGEAISLTGTCQYGVCENVTVTNCGDGSTSSPAVALVQNDEGGTLVGYVRDYTFRNFVITGSDDYGFFGVNPARCLFDNIRIDGSGSLRSGMMLLDATDCKIRDPNITAADTDGLEFRSTGSSANNSVLGPSISTSAGNVTGTGYGMHVIAANSSQTHTKFLLDSYNFGAEGTNTAGAYSFPGGGDQVVGSGQTT